MSGAIIKAKLDVKGQMGLRTQHVRGQAASAKACAERAWTANTFKRCLAWHAFATLGLHPR